MFQPAFGHLQAVHFLQDNSYILCQHMFLFLETDLDIYITAYEYMFFKIV